MRPQTSPTLQSGFTESAVLPLSPSKGPQNTESGQSVMPNMALNSPEIRLQICGNNEAGAFQPAEANPPLSILLGHFAGSELLGKRITSRSSDLSFDPLQGSFDTVPYPDTIAQKMGNSLTPASDSRMIGLPVVSSMPSMFAGPIQSMETRPTVLVIDDEPLYQELIADILCDDYEVLVAESGVIGLQIAMNNVPHLILLDLMMPGIDGYAVFRCLKADRRTCEVPVIFITGKCHVEDETKGLRMGAVDFIAKPINPDLVRARVNTQITFKLMRDKLAMLAATDGLTGLANRFHFDSMLAYEYARHQRSGKELSLIMLDIDQFKAFNDAYGHISGDECLRAVAQAMKKTVSRATDLVARYGGEEFVVLLPETSLNGAVLLAEKIRNCIGDLALPHRDSSAGHVTASLGVVSGKFLTGSSIVDVLTEADIQLYAAKAGGRNRVAYRSIERFGLTN